MSGAEAMMNEMVTDKKKATLNKSRKFMDGLIAEKELSRDTGQLGSADLKNIQSGHRFNTPKQIRAEKRISFERPLGSMPVIFDPNVIPGSSEVFKKRYDESNARLGFQKLQAMPTFFDDEGIDNDTLPISEDGAFERVS